MPLQGPPRALQRISHRIVASERRSADGIRTSDQPLVNRTHPENPTQRGVMCPLDAPWPPPLLRENVMSTYRVRPSTVASGTVFIAGRCLRPLTSIVPSSERRRCHVKWSTWAHPRARAPTILLLVAAPADLLAHGRHADTRNRSSLTLKTPRSRRTSFGSLCNSCRQALPGEAPC